MTNGLYSGVSAMATSQRRMDTLSHNLANLSTTGFKRRTSFVHALQTARGGAAELRVGTKYDFSQGELEYDAEPLHLALEGQGFFAVEGQDGEVYTRNGSFSLTSDGVLVTAQGDPLVWAESRGGLNPTGEEINVDPDGSVWQAGRSVGRLQITNFTELTRLGQNGAGYFVAPDGLEETAHTATVHQGALEKSNASAIEEMISMIAVQRSFERASSVLGMITDTYRRLSRLQ